MLAPLHKENFKKIEQAFSNDQFVYANTCIVDQKTIDQCDLIVGNPPLSLQLNRQNLQAVLLHSVGSEAYVQKNVLASRTLLANASGTYGCAIAEHTLGMIFTINKNIKTYIKNMEDGIWHPQNQGKELYRKSVVIVGLGDLGATIAKCLKAFDCYCIGVKRRKATCPTFLDELYTTDDLDSVLP